MAEGKNKIIVYADWIEIFDPLSEIEAGRLIKHFFQYVNDKNPNPPDRLTELLFNGSIKPTLKRDLKNWLSQQERNKINGRNGGRPKKEKPTETEKTQSVISEPTQTHSNPKKGVKDKDKDNVNVNVIVNDNVNDNILLEKETKVKKIKKKKLIDFSIPIETRRESFKEHLKPFEVEFGLDMVKNFFLYWGEKTKSGKEMRWEIQETWETKLRLERWKNNNYGNTQSKQSPLGTHRMGQNWSEKL